MPRLLVGNFDFERSLAGRGEGALPQTLERINRELAFAWLAIAEEEDTVWLPGRCEHSFLEQFGAAVSWGLPQVVSRPSEAPPGAEGVCWGWCAQWVKALQQAGRRTAAHPPLEIVKRVNSRRFSLELEEALGCRLERSAFVNDEAALVAHLEAGAFSAEEGGKVDQPRRGVGSEPSTGRSGAPRWVLKANYGNSARERLIVSDRGLTESDWGWVQGRLRVGLAVEPWVDIEREAGLQWEISPSGDVRLMGATPLYTDACGRYLGSGFAQGGEHLAEWRNAITTAEEGVHRIAALGYFGPVGIDACRWRTSEGEQRLRVFQDINARWTMGRLSLGWRRLLRAGETGAWLFGAGNRMRGDAGLERAGTVVRSVTTAPAQVDGSPARLPHRVEVYGATLRE